MFASFVLKIFMLPWPAADQHEIALDFADKYRL